MSRTGRILACIAGGLLLVLLLLVIAVWVFTRTEFGVERVRRVAIAQLEERIEGDLDVERITTEGLLYGAKFHNVTLDDPEGRPFLRADSIRLTYSWQNLLRGRIVFDRAFLYDPEVYVSMMPGDTAWNYEYIFPDTTPEDEPGTLILFEQAVVRNGLAVIRYPWEPDEPEVEPEDTARLILEPAPGGLVRVLRFQDVDAVVDRVLWESPVEDGKLFAVESLSTLGYVWEEPFDVRDLEGTVTVRDSLIAFDAPVVRLPESEASALGRIVIGDEDEGVEDRYDVRIEGRDVAFSDLQWLYPPLPEEGGGNLVFRIQTLAPERTLWLARDAYLQTPGTEVAGTFGIVTGDTLYFTQVDLRASPLDMELVQQLVPGDLPLDGLMVGTVEVEGPLSSLTTRGDVRLARRGTPLGDGARVRWSGTVDLRAPLAPHRLEAVVEGLDGAVLSLFRPGLRLRGALAGRVEFERGSGRSVQFAASIRHELTGHAASEFEARGRIDRASPDSTVDVRVETRQLALDALAAEVPALAGLRGGLEGTVTVAGPLEDLRIEGDLASAAGPVAVRGRVGLDGPVPTFRLEGEFADLDLHELLERLPESRADGRFRVDGAGRGLADARADVHLEVDGGRVGAVTLHSGRLDVALMDGLARVDSLALLADLGRLTARGSFGLVADRSGELEVTLDSDSLVVLQPMLFPDTLLVRTDDAAFDRFEGGLHLRAVLDGGFPAFDAEADLVLHDLAYGDLVAEYATMQLTARGAGTADPEVRVQGSARSLAYGRRRLTSARFSVGYSRAGGELALEAGGPEGRTYQVAGAFRRGPRQTRLELRGLEVGGEDGRWRLAAPVAARISRWGLSVDDLTLAREGGVGRIHIAGRLPWRSGVEARLAFAPDPADFQAQLEAVPLGELLWIAQSELPLDGTLDGTLQVQGTAEAPEIRAALDVTGLQVDSVPVGRMEGDVRYADQEVYAEASAWQDDRRILVGGGRIPLDLRLRPVEERRLARRMDVSIQADRVPAVLVTSLLRGFRDVEGWLDGRIAVGGTTKTPALGGALILRNGAGSWRPSGVRYEDVAATFRVLGDRVVAVDGRGRAGSGSATVTGSITFEPLNDPRFDLVLNSQGFLAAQRRDVELVASGVVRLGGRYTRPLVSGSLHVDQGALYLDEIWRQTRVVELEDPLLFNVVDTTRVSMRKILPPTYSPFLRNLVVDAEVDVARDFWLRSKDLSIELTGDVAIAFDRREEDLRLTGVLTAVRGSYQLRLSNLYARRFEVKDGTVEFVGTPGINPNLNITAGYRVRSRRTDMAVSEILANVTGTLQSPRVRLTSDAEQPISETDLISYLIFGQPAYALNPNQSQVLNRAASLESSLLSYGLQAVAPSVLGGVASGLENMLGLVDYVSITTPEILTRDAPGSGTSAFDFGAQIELGRYWGRNADVYTALTQRILAGPGSLEYSDPGFRVEWRFLPNWTAEMFWEDRLARYPSFATEAELEDRDVKGFFLFREWSY